ncbi:MAG: hypothetical protein H7Y61_04465, partial [Rhizobiales bacterium]|nr:hypothetical protein [Rhizobacter sp.]
AGADALTRVLRAGIESLGAQLGDDELAAVLREAAARLGVSAEALSRRLADDTVAVANAPGTPPC